MRGAGQQRSRPAVSERAGCDELRQQLPSPEGQPHKPGSRSNLPPHHTTPTWPLEQLHRLVGVGGGCRGRGVQQAAQAGGLRGVQRQHPAHVVVEPLLVVRQRKGARPRGRASRLCGRQHAWSGWGAGCTQQKQGERNAWQSAGSRWAVQP